MTKRLTHEHPAAGRITTSSTHKWAESPKNIHFQATHADAALIREMAADAELYRRLVASGRYRPADDGKGWVLGAGATKAELDAAAKRALE
jgi:hypothetical protein